MYKLLHKPTTSIVLSLIIAIRYNMYKKTLIFNNYTKKIWQKYKYK